MSTSYTSKLFLNSEWVMAERIEVIDSKEVWNTYALGDGTTVKMKTVVFAVWKILGKFDPRGNPMYWVESHNIMDAISPEELKDYSGQGKPLV